MTDFRSLVDRYLDDESTPEEARELSRLMETRPEAAAYFAEASQLDALLHEHETAQVRVQPRRRLRWAWGLAAACVLAAALGILKLSTPSPPETVGPVAKLERLEGDVQVAHQPARAGLELLAGQSIETPGPSSWALLAFADGTRVELWGNTTVREIRGPRIHLDRGTLVADVASQPPDRPIVFVTPRGEVQVLGTSLRLVADPNRTRLEVRKGKVRLSHEQKSVVVTSGHQAVSAAGVDFVARPTRPSTPAPARALALVRGMPPNSWAAVPGTQLRKVVPDPARHPKIQGQDGPASIVNMWSGGLFDPIRHRLVLWGGGGGKYLGNELYAFNLDALAWERVTEPTPDPRLVGQVNADGTPCSRSTYNGLAFIEHADRMFACGGSCNDDLADLTWTFDFASKKWKDMTPSGQRPPTFHSNAAAYDPHTRRVWWSEHNSRGNGLGVYSYDYDANAWTRHNTDGLSHVTAVVDPRRRLLLFVGAGKVVAYDLGRRDYDQQVWKTEGGEAIVAAGFPGADYDPVADRIVAWAGGAVYALDPDTKIWTAHAAPNAPSPSRNGIFGRWRYVPALDAFIVVTGIDEDVRFYKPRRGN